MTDPNAFARYIEEVNYALSHAIGHPRRVLDVGCGAGQNAAVAKERGAHVVGIENWPPSVAVARTRLDEVIEADIEKDDAAAPLLGRSFDLIVFGDVLEHTKEPRAVLDHFLPFLEDGGRVIVSLPNVAAWPVRLGLLAGKFEYEKTGILDETHLRFFTRKSTMRLVEQAGLEILHVGLNPMIVRAGLGVIKKAFSGAENGDPSKILQSPLYKTYLRYVRPAEGEVAKLLPGPLSFQTVVVGRKPPARRKLSLTVGMVSMNEAGSVGGVIDGVRAHAPGAEVLLVDSSTDETPELARAKGARVVRQFPPRGYGPAMWRLLTEAVTDVVITLDCDGTYPADHIPKLLRLVEEGADLVNTTRTRRRPEAMPLPNYLANRVFAETARALHGLPTTDVHSGMRAYRTSMLRALDLETNAPALPVDLLVVPARMGYRVVEVEIPYFERVGPSTLQRFDGTVWTLKRLLKARTGQRSRRDRYSKI
jgi:SAM-dependent methyltransferase